MSQNGKNRHRLARNANNIHNNNRSNTRSTIRKHTNTLLHKLPNRTNIRKNVAQIQNKPMRTTIPSNRRILPRIHTRRNIRKPKTNNNITPSRNTNQLLDTRQKNNQKLVKSRLRFYLREVFSL